MAEQLQLGAPAPQFTMPTDGGEVVTLSQFKGKPVIVYFYPKDDTPGCTTEAAEFSALMEAFEGSGAVVIGVSADSTESHAKFRAKHDLKVILASDPDRAVIEAYGAWGEKTLYGKKSIGLIRSTVLIDADGAVAKIWRNVRAKGHAQKVLGVLQELAG